MLKEIGRCSKFYQRVSVQQNQPVALVDVDDVIYPCTQVVVDFLNNKYGKQVKLEDMLTFSVYNHFPEMGADQKALNHFLINQFDYMNQSGPYEYAASMLDHLKESGYHVAIVTSRGFHPSGYIYTRNFFNEHDLHFDSLSTVGLGQSKIDFVYDHLSENLDLVFEDSASVIQEALDSNIDVIKFDRAWNSHLETQGVIDKDMNHSDVIKEVDSVISKRNKNA